jgi:hypothetical protein
VSATLAPVDVEVVEVAPEADGEPEGVVEAVPDEEVDGQLELVSVPGVPRDVGAAPGVGVALRDEAC